MVRVTKFFKFGVFVFLHQQISFQNVNVSKIYLDWDCRRWNQQLQNKHVCVHKMSASWKRVVSVGPDFELPRERVYGQCPRQSKQSGGHKPKVKGH